MNRRRRAPRRAVAVGAALAAVLGAAGCSSFVGPVAPEGRVPTSSASAEATGTAPPDGPSEDALARTPPTVSPAPVDEALADRVTTAITAPESCGRGEMLVTGGDTAGLGPAGSGSIEVARFAASTAPVVATAGPSGGAVLPSGTGPATVAVAFACTVDGSPWPQVIGLYDDDLSPVGSVDLGSFDATDQAVVGTLRFDDGSLQVAWERSDADGAGLCSTDGGPDDRVGTFTLGEAGFVTATAVQTTNC